ncbi:Clp protease N-terminal domain-containing protein [Planctomicrobium piriforme]|nr:Clp protease N-terminal domain-containing protein [Planctomicrobium piriforme]
MAISILRDMGLTHGPTFDEAEPETPIPCEGDRTSNPALQEMFSSAVQQAEAFGHNYIGTEHLLLGLLSGNSPAALWLRQRGIDTAAVRAKVDQLMNDH